jgi:hypothetical protein
MSRPIPAQAEPLFILGCVRSGTTVTRDLLRRQPATICPEETHYFRYGDAFRTGAFNRPLLNGKTLQKHREIDGIPEEDFRGMLSKARSRGELLCRHIEYMAQARGLDDYRWFDKTPQNVYGLPMIAGEFPKARFLHIVRNPLNVVASLKLGKQMHVPDVQGAINYWIEAVRIIRQMAPVLRDSLLEIRYEDLVAEPVATMEKLLAFSELGNQLSLYSASDVNPERNQYVKVLTTKEQNSVRRRCARLARQYGYEL